MFGTFKTLILGAQARADEQLREAFSIEVIDQKIREASEGLRLAKATLASLIQRQRSEERQIEALQNRANELETRARAALAGGRADLAAEAAEAIAQLENELTLRRETRARIEARVLKLHASVEATHRRLIDLRQGAVAARALRDEQRLQRRLQTTLSAQSPMSEAEELIARVLGAPDAGEEAEILSEIDKGLTQAGIAERLAVQGFGQPVRTTAADVLARLSTPSN